MQMVLNCHSTGRRETPLDLSNSTKKSITNTHRCEVCSMCFQRRQIVLQHGCKLWYHVRYRTKAYFSKRIAWLKPSPSTCTPWCGISRLDNWKEKMDRSIKLFILQKKVAFLYTLIYFHPICSKAAFLKLTSYKEWALLLLDFCGTYSKATARQRSLRFSSLNLHSRQIFKIQEITHFCYKLKVIQNKL